MTVAVFSALQPEIDLLVDALDRPERADVADWPVWTGEVHGTRAVLAKAGVGKVNMAALAALVWERHRPRLMVCTGVAGGLDPSLGVGDVVIGERTIQHDAGVAGPAGLQRYQAGRLPFYNPTDQLGFAPSGRVLGSMRRVVDDTALMPVLGEAPTVAFGTIVTGDQFLQDRTTRDRLFADLGAQAVEMEGAALAQTAQRLGVEHIVIRSLSDLATGEAVANFDRFVSEASANSARLALGLIARLEEDDRDLALGS